MDPVASWRRVLAALLAAFVVVGTGAAGVGGVAGVASADQAATTLYVDDGSASTGDEFCAPGVTNATTATNTTRYQEIQTAVLNASEGDTVRVCDGTYSTFVVNERLTVVGAGGVVDLEGASGPAVFLEVDASGAVIEGLPVRNAGVGVFARTTDVTVADASFEGIGERAVDLSNADGATLRNVTVNGSAAGVRIEDSPGVSVESSTFQDLTGPAVDLRGTDGATVSGLNVTDAPSGVSVRSSADVTVADSTFERVDESAVTVRNSGGATVSGLNVTNGSTGVDVLAAGGNEVSDVVVRNVAVRNLTDGLRADVSEGATLSGLTLSDLDVEGTDRGVELFASGSGSVLANVTVEGSTVVDSAERGIGVSTLDGTARVRDVLLENLTVEGSGAGEGVSLSARAGELRNVTLENASVTSHEVGVVVSNDDAVLRDVIAFRNRITDNAVGVGIDGSGPRSNTQDVAVRQNLVSNASDVGVLVGSGTDVDGVRVTRNVIRGNGFGVRNEGDGVLAAWLNYWGADSGPSTGTGVVDPGTGTSADGDGDAVSSAVRFDPWLGKGACPAPGVRSVADGPFELYEVSIGLAELQSFCAWDLAPLSLRPDPADAATNVENLNVSYELEGTDGPVPADRSNVTIYEAGETFDLQFGAGSTDTSAFAGNETQLIVLRDPGSASPSFDVGFDHRVGETVLRSDAESATTRTDWGRWEDGELTGSFTPRAAGTYTFVLVEREFGSGIENGTASGAVRVDGGATVLGFETVTVRSTGAGAAVNDTNASDAGLPAGSGVPLALSSNLGSGSTDHAVLLYDESRFRNATMTVRVDATAADVLAGEFDPEGDVTVESSVAALNGFYRAAAGFSALGVDVPVTDDSGRVDPSPVLGLGTRLYDTTGASRTTGSGATLLNGSVLVETAGGSSTTVEVETFRNFSTGTYRYVYLARQGRSTSADTGVVELTDPAETPTPTATPEDGDDGGGGGGGGDGGDGGGGGGGGQVGGDPGEVEVESAELLNETVTTEDSVVVRFDLFNPDPAGGEIELSLETNGTVVVEDTVRVSASSRRTVFLETTIGTPGTYEVASNGSSLGSLTVTEAATDTQTEVRTPTRTPSPGPDTGTAPPTATPAGDEPMGASAGQSAESPAGGPPPATETETVVALGMALLLLYGVGVAVYVLRENPPSRFG